MSSYLPYLLLILVLVISGVLNVKRSGPAKDKEKTTYHYEKKLAVMTEHEQNYFKILSDAVGDRYYILAQAHLTAFLNHKVEGQNWNPAFRHINGKSIDYLICDKMTLAPFVGIELNDASHDRYDRHLRDTEVQRIFDEAQLPLIIAPVHGLVNVQELSQQIDNLIQR